VLPSLDSATWLCETFNLVSPRDLGARHATPLWAKCEGETHTPKSGNLESSGTPKNSELKLKA
jgi:hypothetical protein